MYYEKCKNYMHAIKELKKYTVSQHTNIFAMQHDTNKQQKTVMIQNKKK